MKPRRCSVRGCRNPAIYCTPVQGWCSDEHRDIVIGKAVQKARERKGKEARAKHREDKAKVKTMAQLKQEAQAAVNAYVRRRDKGKPCASCGRPDDGTHQRHAGHWKTVKARPDIRFDPMNIMATCSQCNVYEGGGLHPGYLPELIRRHGQAEVDRLSVCTVRRYTREELTAIKAAFREQAKP